MVTFPEIFNGLLFRAILAPCTQNLKFLALPVPEIIGGTQKIEQSLDMHCGITALLERSIAR